MGIIIIVFLLLFFAAFIYLCYLLIRWVFKNKRRTQVFQALLVIGVVGISIHHFFFKDMHFIQSEVYSNLYLVEYLDKDYSVVEEAIKEKIKEHLKSEHKTGKPLSYSGENAIYFYELGGMTLGFIGDAGTGYFIDHEEDLGGFVSEELGMYTNYRLAEFYYDPCPQDASVYCGEINFFREGEHFRVDSLTNLDFLDKEPNNLPHQQTSTQEVVFPLHGLLDKEALATYYPEVLSEFNFNGKFHAKRIAWTNGNGAILSLLQHTDSNSDYFLYSHDQNFKVIDSFYIGEAMDFDNGKSVTIDYDVIQDTSISFNKVVFGAIIRNNEETIDTLAHETTTIQINKNGTLHYTISKNPKFYSLEVFDRDSGSDGIQLRDKPNGNIIQTLDTTGDGYIISIVSGENGWFRVLKIDSIDVGELEMPYGIAWVHHSEIGIRANRETSVFDSPKNGKQIGNVPMDGDLNIIDLEQDWVKIEYQNLTGWVDSKSLCGNPLTTCP
ncbi:hypothetical protein [Algoriphagus zhangzhouensis]|uniref:SH3 domain-containing protein n=1 Tax=Algoriphagus zhangzhouensis TaxID=1073327 RepID=A0A1M7ZHL9_9BACT|nr:hypothetical protein [Algoriphagus zhangzhouensis]TDY44165.1 hypothetical protein A8938_3376 [Algoriphagus zhangzhouensis]SHO64319.1 hypothetical protein SAMN04488108_3371 [Algoriphagus zhangzhouensis]